MKLTLLKEKEFEIETSEVKTSVLTLNQVEKEITLMQERKGELEKQIAGATEALANVESHKTEMEDIKKEMDKQLK